MAVGSCIVVVVVVFILILLLSTVICNLSGIVIQFALWPFFVAVVAPVATDPAILVPIWCLVAVRLAISFGQGGPGGSGILRNNSMQCL
jgi:hypothetical protein